MHNLKLSQSTIYLSYIAGAFVTGASLMGLFFSFTYGSETTNWATQAMGQDVGNIIAVATLAFALNRLKKGSWLGFSLWTGSLFYIAYAYLIYAFALHFNYLFLVYVAIMGLSVSLLISGLFTNIDSLKKVHNKLHQRQASVGNVLIFIGLIFGMLWLKEIIPALIGGLTPDSAVQAGLVVNPVHVIDLSLALPGAVLAGVSLRRKGLLGDILAGPWLVFAVLMGLSIIASMILMAIKGLPGALQPVIPIALIVAISLAAFVKYYYAARRQLSK